MKTRRRRESLRLKDFTCKPYLIFLVLSLLVFCKLVHADFVFGVKKENEINKLLEQVNEDQLINELRMFVGQGKPNRMVGSTGHMSSFNYLKNLLEQHKGSSATVSVHQFTPDIDVAIKFYESDFEEKVARSYPVGSEIYNKWDKFTKGVVWNLRQLKGVSGKNIVWEKKGKDSSAKTLILGAHYDTIGYDKEGMVIVPNLEMEGADDNGTGVAILLSLIKLLNKIEISNSVKIIFFDFQELGLLGSIEYVKTLDRNSISSFLGVEMLGHDSKLYDKTKKNMNMKLYTRKLGTPGQIEDRVLANSFSKAGMVFNRKIKFDISETGHDFGDHFSFWNAGIPAIVFTQDMENDFNTKGNHTAADFVEAVNWKTFYNSFQFIAGSVIYHLL